MSSVSSACVYLRLLVPILANVLPRSWPEHPRPLLAALPAPRRLRLRWRTARNPSRLVQDSIQIGTGHITFYGMGPLSATRVGAVAAGSTGSGGNEYTCSGDSGTAHVLDLRLGPRMLFTARRSPVLPRTLVAAASIAHRRVYLRRGASTMHARDIESWERCLLWLRPEHCGCC